MLRPRRSGRTEIFRSYLLARPLGGRVALQRAMRGSARFCHRRNHHVLPAVWFMAGFSRALPSVARRMLVVNELRVEPEQQAILGVWGEGSFKPNPKPNSRPQPTLSPIPALP